ncbi:MAG: HlyD family efflux transporter periplasmic adaptor subunit [Phenylobacterium sp.]|uniref:efflux RND transporter periplasmic adaptor subunit n=1 Tax=Phenylobacterium sp. TaxID=1871053 RepID=UPI001A3CAE20|nr:HlyD family efflux transporter periplasmic adaptor subunit [Phenylobacterium sp.]MBL8556215.1 HlyD family efflux transporter periplasmic adaptor subunit [Phenylobacterium sp.]
MRAILQRRRGRLIVILALSAALAACGQRPSRAPEGEAHAAAASDLERGPHRGRLLRDGDFALEVTLYEEGPTPIFRLYPYRNGKPVDPKGVGVNIALTRLGAKVDRFTLIPEADYLTSPAPVHEPHSFDVSVSATYAGRAHRWAYSSYEGRTTIAADAARAGGVTTEKAGPALLGESLAINGRVEITPEGQSDVIARYPGRVTSLNAELGQRVRRGQVLARVESSESLQTYPVTAPISGVIVKKNVTAGGMSGNEPILVVADPDKLHAEFFLYPRDAERVRVGQRVEVVSLAGDHRVVSTVEAILPTADLTNQTLIAHVHMPSGGEAWRPGLGVKGTVTVGASSAPLAVRTRAIQPFRDFEVVYAKVGDTYEVRMLEIGRRTPEWTEVLGGLEPGTEYVVDGAFLIRADIEKSGASHDH